jgi:hypothetical protein
MVASVKPAIPTDRRYGMRWLALVGFVLVAAAAATAGEADGEGFVRIFDGKTLEGWDGNPDFWSVKDGAIHGETTKEKPARGNTFCIWRGGMLEDYELKITFRIHSGNSGIQHRSVDCGKWVVSGYQAEVCNSPAVGFLYGERGRGGLVGVGQKVVIAEDGKKEVVGNLPDAKKAWESYKKQDWNDYLIIAKGNHIQHFLNGIQTIDLVDNCLDDPDAEKRDLKKGRLKGILALQIHAGPPMWVEFKDIRIKDLSK